MPLTTNATIPDAQQFTTTIQQAGGAVPTVLANLLGGATLLNEPVPVQSSILAIVAASRDGLTQDRLNGSVAQAAVAQSNAAQRGELRNNSERQFVAEFHTVLAEGAADEVLDSLRPAFDKAAEAIASARSLIPADTGAEAFLHSAKPVAVAAWQKLPEHLSTIASIADIARQFGPRLGKLPRSRSTAWPATTRSTTAPCSSPMGS